MTKQNKNKQREPTKKKVEGSLQTEIAHRKLKPEKVIVFSELYVFKVNTEKDLYMEVVIQPQLNTIAIYI